MADSCIKSPACYCTVRGRLVIDMLCVFVFLIYSKHDHLNLLKENNFLKLGLRIFGTFEV